MPNHFSPELIRRIQRQFRIHFHQTINKEEAIAYLYEQAERNELFSDECQEEYDD